MQPCPPLPNKSLVETSQMVSKTVDKAIYNNRKKTVRCVRQTAILTFETGYNDGGALKDNLLRRIVTAEEMWPC